MEGSPVSGAAVAAMAALIAASGFFSLFNQALKSVRKARLQKEADDLAEKGGGTAALRRAIAAAEHPEAYHAAACFYICVLRALAATAAGVYAGRIAQTASVAAPAALCAAMCAVAIVPAILIFGHLLPGFIARRAPERIVTILLPVIKCLTLPLRPFLLLARLTGRRLESAFPPAAEQSGITEDDLRQALMDGEKSGIVESKERTMVEGVFYLGDRSLGTFMTHRSEIQWLDIHSSAEDIHAKVLEYRTQRCFPVTDGSLDSIIGSAYLEDIILDFASPSPAGLRAVMKEASFAPETMPALKAFEASRRGSSPFLFVMDEYGGFAGMVSVGVLMEEIVGELASPVNKEQEIIKLEDGSWLADGSMNIDDAAELFPLPDPAAAGGDYHTLAGFLLSLAGELPREGDSFSYRGHRFTVLDMDGNRIDKIGIKKEG